MKTRSEVARQPRVSTDPTRDGRRKLLLDLVQDRLRPGEVVVAMLPYATVPKRARGPEGKVRLGVRQSWRRYRPLVLTNRQVIVFDTGRTPHPRAVLAAFAVADVHFVEQAPGRFGQIIVVLDLPGLGPVPFETGRLERDDVLVLEAFLRDR